MAGKKSEPRNKQPERSPVTVPTPKPNPITRFAVTNTANQPREFRLSGKWYRWGPRGQRDDTLTLAESIANKSDFKAVAHYFVVKKEAK